MKSIEIFGETVTIKSTMKPADETKVAALANAVFEAGK